MNEGLVKAIEKVVCCPVTVRDFMDESAGVYVVQIVFHGNGNFTWEKRFPTGADYSGVDVLGWVSEEVEWDLKCQNYDFYHDF